MVALDKSKKYAKVCGEDTKGVAWKQAGRLFNAQFQEVNGAGELMNGESADMEPAAVPAKKERPALDTIPALLKAKDSTPFMAWKKAAGAFLDPCPGTKADIVAHLEAKAIATGTVTIAPVEPAARPEDAPTVEALKVREAAPDEIRDKLNAWGDKRISQKLLFGDVQKMIRVKYNKVINNERDAINFLIDSGVVPAEWARNV
jgi:hypothetical protein